MVVPVFANIFVGQVKQWAIVANDEYFFHAEVIDAAKSKLRAAIEENGGMTMSDIRTLIDTVANGRCRYANILTNPGLQSVRVICAYWPDQDLPSIES